MQGMDLKSKTMTYRDGFTLIEVMIAVAILGIGILGVASMQMAAINGNSTAGKLTANATLVMDRIERLTALPYAHPDLAGTAYDDSDLVTFPLETQGLLHNPGTGADGLDNNRDGRIDEVGETGDISIQWRVVDNYPFDEIKTVRITVAQGIGNNRKTVTIVTYKMDAI